MHRAAGGRKGFKLPRRLPMCRQFDGNSYLPRDTARRAWRRVRAGCPGRDPVLVASGLDLCTVATMHHTVATSWHGTALCLKHVVCVMSEMTARLTDVSASDRTRVCEYIGF